MAIMTLGDLLKKLEQNMFPTVPRTEQAFRKEIVLIAEWPDDLADPDVRQAAIKEFWAKMARMPHAEAFWPANIFSTIGLIRIWGLKD